MSHYILPAIGLLFIGLALFWGGVAVKDGGDRTLAKRISVRTRIKIAVIFAMVGIGLFGWHLMLPAH
jgi:hypothetical protein